MFEHSIKGPVKLGGPPWDDIIFDAEGNQIIGPMKTSEDAAFVAQAINTRLEGALGDLKFIESTTPDSNIGLQKGNDYEPYKPTK